MFQSSDQLPVNDFLSRSEYPPEWFCVLVSLLPRSSCTDVTVFATLLASWSPRGRFIFGAEEIPVSAATAEEWLHVIKQMCDAHLVSIATKNEVELLRAKYAWTSARLPPNINVAIGQVVVREAGYVYWRKYLSVCNCEEYLVRRTYNEDGACMIVARTVDELNQQECPAMDPHYMDGVIRRGGNHSGICSREASPVLCKIEWYGPFWTDDYNISPTGSSLVCACRVKSNDVWNQWGMKVERAWK